MAGLGKSVGAWLVGIFSFHLLSLVVHPAPVAQAICIALLSVFLAYGTWKFPALTTTILLAELGIGSKGHLLVISTGSFDVSVRIVAYAVVMLVWIARLVVEKRMPQMPSQLPFLVLSAGVLFAGVIGVFRYGFSETFLDLNGWLALGLLPLASDTLRTATDRARLIQALIAVAIWLGVESVGLLILFSHGLIEIGDPLYRWIRETGIGEITLVTGTVFRIFIQSQVFFLLIGAITVGVAASTQKHRPWWYALTYLCSLSLLISQSRSFWIGAICTFGFLLLAGRISALLSFKRTSILIGAVMIAIGSQLLVVNLLTASWSHSGLLQRFSNLDAEPASSTRIAQLPVLQEAIRHKPIFGYGFGKSLTYMSNDPRVREQNPTGQYTTTAFEWGYLDIVLKMGIVGLLAYAWLIWSVVRQDVSDVFKKKSSLFQIALLAGLVGLLTTHMFSPYLNHPLGFGFFALILVLQRKNHSDEVPNG